MADLSDVESAIVASAEAVLAAVAPAPAIYRGAPAPARLTQDLETGVVHVTIFPRAGATRDVTRWMTPPVWLPGTPTLLVAAEGEQVSFSGDAAPGQLAGVLVDGAAYVHRTGAGDSPDLVAAVLGTMIAAVRPCTVSGGSIVIPGASGLTGRVAADGTSVSELRRQAQEIEVTVWAGTPSTRDQIASALDVGLAVSPFLTLADGTSALLRYVSSASDDAAQDAALYRRVLRYEAEYATTLPLAAPSMLFGDVFCNGSSTYG